MSKVVKNPWESSLSKFCFIIKHFQAGVLKHKLNFDNEGLCNALVVDEHLDFRSKECGVGKRTCRDLLWIDYNCVSQYGSLFEKNRGQSDSLVC